MYILYCEVLMKNILRLLHNIPLFIFFKLRDFAFISILNEATNHRLQQVAHCWVVCTSNFKCNILYNYTTQDLLKMPASIQGTI